jgi:hexosaminidase
LNLTDSVALWIEPETTDIKSLQKALDKRLKYMILPVLLSVKPYQIKIPKPENWQAEAYRLEIEAGGIIVYGESNGLKHALQSLIQLIWWAYYHNEMQLPYLAIEDYPECEWRGLHLDVSRHFFAAEEVCSYLDKMASIKLNRFHWHLTDDQGWRIESHKFPKLNTIAAWRKESDGSSYGGFYTQKEIKQVVRYATELGIEVIPEIDIPGHSQAILAADNELACFPKAFETLNCWGISEDILCAGKEATLSFLKELFSEITELFPGRYVHLGGDEAPKTNWKKCPHCQKRIKDKGLEDEDELQSWLLKELTMHLKTLKKTVIGWDEILDGKPGKEPIVMVWRGDGKDAAKKAETSGNRYILCPNQICYFDWHQSSDEGEPGAFGVTTLEQVYSFDPSVFGNKESKLLLGAQGNVWTEQMPSFERVIYMAFPRATALAESLWSDPQSKDFEDFKSRLEILRGCL